MTAKTTTPLYRSRPGGFDIHPASQSEARRINDFVYVSEGLSNSYLLTTNAGRVVINTGMGFEAIVHKRNYDAIDERPIRYILLTQGHTDHVGGVDRFLHDADESIEVVAQANNAAHQQDDFRIAQFRVARSSFAWREAIMAAMKFMQQNAGSGIPSQSRPTPTLTFEDALQLRLGELKLELISTPGGETKDSMVVWLPEQKICFTGNLFSALFGHFPNLVTVRGDRYRDPLAFVESLNRVLDLEPEVLLPGHHGPIEGKQLIQDELTRLRDAVMYVHDETVKGMNRGKSVHELMREIKLPSEIEVGEGYGKVSWSVRAIWENYAGWFHHSSTTELYSVPASSVHADLTELAGGADVLAKKAAEKVDNNELQQAIHLAEIALHSDPKHAPSLRVCIVAHERLAQESENFWLSSWLETQLEGFNKRLKEIEG